MSDTLPNIRQFMEGMGIPGRDGHDLPTSGKTFPDGAHYRIEIAGVERISTMETMIEASKARGITIHRAIAAVGGATYCDFEELKAMYRGHHDRGPPQRMGCGGKGINHSRRIDAGFQTPRI